MSSFAAIDLGASSGRVVVGTLRGGRVEIDELHRFANRPLSLPGGLRFDPLALLQGTLDGLAAAGDVDGIAVDAWGVDYGLLDERGELLGLPFHHRDGRGAGIVERALARVGRERLYAVTGIQTMPINTVFQLLADDPAQLARARRIALVADLIALWLCGELANERTAASTTGLLDARSGDWARELIAELGLPGAPFADQPTEPGTRLGALLRAHGEATGVAAGTPVLTVAGHDTASAFAAAPLRGPDAAILSSGTWSLLGVQVDEPVLGERAREYNLTNERGIDGTTRLLRNVMGLWLVQECRRAYHRASDVELLGFAAAAQDRAGGIADVPLFDPDDDALLAPGRMPQRIADACERAGQRRPDGPGETVLAILVSLACKYRLVLERLEAVLGRRLATIHVVGGGARNAQLCRLTAQIAGRPVLAGPVEATALGNVLVQARALGALASAAELRAAAIASAAPVDHEPDGDAAGAEAEACYERFLGVTGLAPALTTTRSSE